MRYKLIAAVEGNLFLSESVSIENQESVVEFLRNRDGKLENISISKPVPNSKIGNFMQSVEPGTGNAKLKITVGGDKELHNELIKELQTIESNLAFASQGLLKRIRWDKPKQEYIPENSDEEKLFSIRSFSANAAYPLPKANITPRLLIGLIELSAKYESLLLAKSFWREGMIYFGNFQYIQAFYQFYFVIEDFYISGKTSSKKSVMKKFQESTELLEIAQHVLTKVSDTPRHLNKLQSLLADYDCEYNAIGLLEMLYESRNNLHHFFSRSTKIQGTPFNQSYFETIALLVMHISTTAIAFREVKISQSLKNEQT